MLRVGFLLDTENTWSGGISYFRNLFFAISENLRDSIQPVLITPSDASMEGLGWPTSVVVVSKPPSEEGQVIRKRVARRALGRDVEIASLCEEHRIDLLSHSGTFGWRFPVPTMPWIPDFQHRRFPEYFSTLERRRRDYVFLCQLLEGSVTVLSSYAAQRDAQRFYGRAARRTEVLQFVSQSRMPMGCVPSLKELQQRHQIPDQYFFLPNQFWQHKNHRVVVEALVIARRRGFRPTVVLTGQAVDYRAPGHYPKLMIEVAERGLSAQFLHLGMVPFNDLISLMRYSVAVINPSLFEGWSNTVEEARSLGKRTILSDIDVHREQAPDGAVFFPRRDGDALASAMSYVWEMVDFDSEFARERYAERALPIRTAEFARNFARFVDRAL